MFSVQHEQPSVCGFRDIPRSREAKICTMIRHNLDGEETDADIQDRRRS